MAVELHGFSIREYVSEMRSVDVERSWPFGSVDQLKNSELDASDFLPPITVTKFRWWSHELDLSISNRLTVRDNDNDTEPEIITRNEDEKFEGEKLDRHSTAVEVDADEEDIDDSIVHVEAEKKGKKAKAPKKRSIVEIFAISPPIFPKIGDDDSKMKKKRKLSRDKLKKEVSNSNKETLRGLKQQTIVKSNGLYSSSCHRRLSNDDSVFICKNKSIPKWVPRKKKPKAVQSSNSIAKHHKPVIPVCGVLGKQVKGPYEKNSASIYDMQCRNEASPFSIQASEKHVRFAGAASSSKEVLLKSDTDLKFMEADGSDEEFSFGSEERFEAQNLNESTNRDFYNTSELSRPQVSCQEIAENLSENDSHARNSEILFPVNEMYNYVTDYQNGTISRYSNSDENMVDRMVGYPIHGISATSSTAHIKTLTQRSSNSFAGGEITNVNYNFPPLLQAATENYNLTLEYQPFRLPSHTELMSNVCSVPKQKPFALERNIMGGDYFGLPLNSLGGYINRTHPKDHCKLMPFQKHVQENPNVTPSRYGVMESHEQFIPWKSDITVVNNSLHDHRKYDSVQSQVVTRQSHPHEYPNSNRSHITQPTVRLMGKDVAVGRNSDISQGYENGKVWTDKQIITEHLPSCTVTDHSVSSHFHSDCFLPHSLDPRSRQLSQGVPDFSNHPSHLHTDWPSNMISEKYRLPIDKNLMSNLHTFAHQSISPTLFNRLPNLLSDILSQNTKSAFEFPLLHPDHCREHVEPYWFQETSKKLPSWLLHASQEKETVSTCSFASPSLAEPPLVPIIPGCKPTSVVNMAFQNRCKLKDKVRVNPLYVKNLDSSCITKKRRATKLDDSRRQTKIPNIAIQEGFSPRENSIFEMHSNEGVFELSSRRGEASTSFGMDYPKSDGMMRPSSHRLSAGTKHILKPGKSVDQDKSIPTYSTISFPVTTSSGRIPELPKLAKIYRF